ncbi:hypothetical protein [Winogradskyella pacifica]|nr:hypothetical protein [Winogradskyella pacifica]
MSNINKTDTEIANAAINAMKWNASVPNTKLLLKLITVGLRFLVS